MLITEFRNLFLILLFLLSSSPIHSQTNDFNILKDLKDVRIVITQNYEGAEIKGIEYAYPIRHILESFGIPINEISNNVLNIHINGKPLSAQYGDQILFSGAEVFVDFTIEIKKKIILKHNLHALISCPSYIPFSGGMPFSSPNDAPFANAFEACFYEDMLNLLEQAKENAKLVELLNDTKLERFIWQIILDHSEFCKYEEVLSAIFKKLNTSFTDFPFNQEEILVEYIKINSNLTDSYMLKMFDSMDVSNISKSIVILQINGTKNKSIIKKLISIIDDNRIFSKYSMSGTIYEYAIGSEATKVLEKVSGKNGLTKNQWEDLFNIPN